MQTIFWILSALMVLLNLLTVYLGIIFLFTFRKRRSYPKAKAETRFAVIVPARNEENVVGNLIAALKAQSYPQKKIDIFVAVNNTTDNTEAVALEAGAQVIRCEGTITNKGQVLNQIFDRIRNKGYDAYVVFDADNIPDRDFLQRMNDALAAGERVCKGRLKCGNFAESWVSGSYGLHHALMEMFYSKPHTEAGFSSNLFGTAFAVHREVIDAMNGWHTETICEDTEFAAQATRMGWRVAFVYDAMSYDEQVTQFGVSLCQRHRWCYGMIQCARLMTRSMFSRACPKKGMARDFGMIFIISHTAPVAGLLGMIGMLFMPAQMLPLMGIGVIAALVGCILLAVFLCFYGGYPVSKMIPAIVGFPVFMASWAPLQLYALVVPVKTWSEIRHSGQGDV